jgi:hypothetical protein
MLRSSGVMLVIGLALVVGGVLAGLLPKDWVEQFFNVDPDAGSGALELLVTLVPLVIGVALCAVALALRGRAAHSSTEPRARA